MQTKLKTTTTTPHKAHLFVSLSAEAASSFNCHTSLAVPLALALISVLWPFLAVYTRCPLSLAVAVCALLINCIKFSDAGPLPLSWSSDV